MLRVLYGLVQSELLLSSPRQPHPVSLHPRTYRFFRRAVVLASDSICSPPTCHEYQLTFPHRRWIARVGKVEALQTAGVTLPPSGSKDVKDVPEAVQKDQGAIKVVAFDVVSVDPSVCSSGNGLAMVHHRIAPLDRKLPFVKYRHVALSMYGDREDWIVIIPLPVDCATQRLRAPPLARFQLIDIVLVLTSIPECDRPPTMSFIRGVS